MIQVINGKDLYLIYYYSLNLNNNNNNKTIKISPIFNSSMYIIK